MESLFSYVAPPSPCGYLPHQKWSLEYEMVHALTPAEYQERLEEGWRRFGSMLFRPRCHSCRACLSLRVMVDYFAPDRSMRRVQRANQEQVRLRIGPPRVDRSRLHLYDRYHAFQSHSKGWPIHPAKDAASYHDSFVNNPILTEEWCFFVGDRLAGVGYVDALPSALSAIYYFYDPEERGRSLGTWNILCLLGEAAARKIPNLYLGYYVADCPSLAYKARFQPNQVLEPAGQWRNFLPRERP